MTKYRSPQAEGKRSHIYTEETEEAKAQRYDIYEKFRKLSATILLRYNEREGL